MIVRIRGGGLSRRIIDVNGHEINPSEFLHRRAILHSELDVVQTHAETYNHEDRAKGKHRHPVPVDDIDALALVVNEPCENAQQKAGE